MKREIAGKMMSDVKGVEDVTAATAKELKATRTDAKYMDITFTPGDDETHVESQSIMPYSRTR